MSVDKFGRHSGITKRNLLPIYRAALTSRTPEGDIDAKGYKICNIKEPTDDSDATNKKYVDTAVTKLKTTTDALIDDKIRVVKKDFKKLKDDNKQLNDIIVKEPPTASKDLANKKYVDQAIANSKAFLRADIRKESGEILHEVHLYVKGYIYEPLEKRLNELAKKIESIKKLPTP